MFLGRLRFVLPRHQLTHFDKILTNYPSQSDSFSASETTHFSCGACSDEGRTPGLQTNFITDVNKNPAGKSFNHSATIPPVCFLPPTSIQNVKWIFIPRIHKIKPTFLPLTVDWIWNGFSNRVVQVVSWWFTANKKALNDFKNLMTGGLINNCFL